VELVLPGAGSIVGTVVDEKGAAVPFIDVTASAMDDRFALPARADATEGRFELELKPGAYTLTARAEGYAAELLTLTVGDEGVNDLHFSLRRGGRIRGRIVDAAGRGVGHLRVAALAGEGPPVSGRTGFTIAAPDGTFILADLAAGAYTLSTGGEPSGFALVSGVNLDATGVVLRLAPGGRVRVLVRQANGSPAGGVRIGVHRVDGHPVGGLGGASTDAGGAAELWVPSGRIDLRATGPSLEGGTSVAVAPGETAAAEVELRPR
jgi:hypothetical protein